MADKIVEALSPIEFQMSAAVSNSNQPASCNVISKDSQDAILIRLDEFSNKLENLSLEVDKQQIIFNRIRVHDRYSVNRDQRNHP